MTVDERESEIGALLEAARLLEHHSGSQAAELRRRAMMLASLRGTHHWHETEGHAAA